MRRDTSHRRWYDVILMLYAYWVYSWRLFCYYLFLLLVNREGCNQWLWHFLGIFTYILIYLKKCLPVLHLSVDYIFWSSQTDLFESRISLSLRLEAVLHDPWKDVILYDLFFLQRNAFFSESIYVFSAHFMRWHDRLSDIYKCYNQHWNNNYFLLEINSNIYFFVNSMQSKCTRLPIQTLIFAN